MTICGNKLYRPNAIDPSDCAHCNRVAEDAAAEFRPKWKSAYSRARSEYARLIEDARAEWAQRLGAILEDEIGFDPFEDKGFDEYPDSPLHMEWLDRLHGIQGKAEDDYVDRAVEDAHDKEE